MQKYMVAIISGASWYQINKQVITNLERCPIYDPSKLYIFPTNATSFYRYNSIDKKWFSIYSEVLSKVEKHAIISVINQMLIDLKIETPIKIWGSRIEDRSTQITFSNFGQQAPQSIKANWDPNFLKRLEMMEYLSQKLTGFDVYSGGSTSIDITKKGFDRKLAIHQIVEKLEIDLNDVIYVGDSIVEGCTGYPVKSTGISIVTISNQNDVISFIKGLLG